MEERARIREEEKQRRKIERFQALIAVCMRQNFNNFLFALYLDFLLCSVFPTGKPFHELFWLKRNKELKNERWTFSFRNGKRKKRRRSKEKNIWNHGANLVMIWNVMILRWGLKYNKAKWRCVQNFSLDDTTTSWIFCGSHSAWRTFKNDSTTGTISWNF